MDNVFLGNSDTVLRNCISVVKFSARYLTSVLSCLCTIIHCNQVEADHLLSSPIDFAENVNTEILSLFIVDANIFFKCAIYHRGM